MKTEVLRTTDTSLLRRDGRRKREYESTNIPTVLSATTNRNHDFYIFPTQRYNLGFSRDIPQTENDTTPAKQEFVPVTSFIHTIQVERARHSFNSDDDMREKNYYQNTLFGTG